MENLGRGLQNQELDLPPSIGSGPATSQQG